jgi:hypothetical protein
MTGDIKRSKSLEAMVDRLMDSGPALARVMTKSAEDVAKNARYLWPYGVRKYKSTRPHSRDMIRVSTGTVSGGEIVSFVEIKVDYAFYIKSWKNGLNGKSPWQELLRKPGIAEGKRLGAVLAEELAEIAGGGRG